MTLLSLLKRNPARSRRHADAFVFIHINKTGGSSIETALNLPHRHRTALKMREVLGRQRWNEKYTFSIVRNPWDKVVSQYEYRRQENHGNLRELGIGFREWVRRTYGSRDPALLDNEKMFLPQMDWLTDEEGRLLVDYVGRFETLRSDFDLICRRIGRRATLPHVKSSRRGDYRLYYDDATREIVGTWFREDIRAYDYRF